MGQSFCGGGLDEIPLETVEKKEGDHEVNNQENTCMNFLFVR